MNTFESDQIEDPTLSKVPAKSLPLCDPGTADRCKRVWRVQSDHEIEELVGELVETQDQLLAMYDLAKAAYSQLGINETLHHLAREASHLVHTEGAVICLGPTMVQHPTDMISQCNILSYVREAQQQGLDYILLNATQDHLPVGITTICVLPMKVRRDLAAALCLINRSGGFSAPDLKLARAIANQAGMHIERTLFYNESLEQARLQTEFAIARQVQLQMLPQSRPSLKTLDIYAESRPALQVGGDFYDFVLEPDRPPMLLLGDVAGKGMSAAMIMGLVHTATRSAARFMPGATPATVLSRSNNDLYDDLTRLDSFITVFACQYLVEKQLVRYANAGHAPVIYRPAHGSARILEADGVPIGVLPMSLSEDYSLPFGPGDLLVVTTDGFSEACAPNGDMYGYERILALIDEFAEQPSQVIAYGLYSAIDMFTAGRTQEDDQTLIVIKGITP